MIEKVEDRMGYTKDSSNGRKDHGQIEKDETYTISPHQSPTILLEKLLASTFGSFDSNYLRTAVTHLH